MLAESSGTKQSNRENNGTTYECESHDGSKSKLWASFFPLSVFLSPPFSISLELYDCLLSELRGRAHNNNKRKKGRRVFDAKFFVRLLSHASADPFAQVKRIRLSNIRRQSQTQACTQQSKQGSNIRCDVLNKSFPFFFSSPRKMALLASLRATMLRVVCAQMKSMCFVSIWPYALPMCRPTTTKSHGWIVHKFSAWIRYFYYRRRTHSTRGKLVSSKIKTVRSIRTK